MKATIPMTELAQLRAAQSTSFAWLMTMHNALTEIANESDAREMKLIALDALEEINQSALGREMKGEQNADTAK